MRRFELVEGKSAKFWEVDVEGSELHLRWGRLGTNGQSQTKSFASEAAAQKEADKLVREKTKKGYAEVDVEGDAGAVKKEEKAEATAEPSPAPPPRPVEVVDRAPAAPASASFEPRVREDVLASLLPSWSRPNEGRSAAWAAVRSGASHQLKNITKLHLAPPADRERTERWEAMVTAAEEPALDLDAAAQLLGSLPGPAQPYLAARFSDADLVRIALRSGSYWWTYRYSGNHHVQILTDAFADLSVGLHEACAAARVADALSPADREAITSEVEAAWSGWPLAQRTRAAIVLGRDARWADRVMESASSYPKTMLTLVGAIESGAQLERLLAGFDTQGWFYLATDPLAVLVARRGTSAAPLLVRLAAHLKENRSVVTVMSALESLDVAAAMGDLLEHRELKALARPYLESAPALALAALGKTRKQAVRSFVEVLVRSNGALLDALLPQLDGETRGAIEQIRDASAVDVPDASASELPSVLVDPPWTRPKKASKPVTLALEPIEMPEAIDWREGQKAEWLAAQAWGQPSKQGNEQLLRAVAAWVDREAGDVPEWHNGVNLSAFFNAEDDLALACWNRMTPAALGWTYADGIRRMVARFEERGIPGYVAYAGKNAPTAAELFLRVRSPRLAPFYAKVLASRGKARAYAQAWIESYPEEAAAGLIPEALGKDKRPRAIAEQAIAYLGQKGHREAVLRAAERYGGAAIAPVTELLEFDPLDSFPPKLPPIPEWARHDALPRPLLMGRGEALPRSAVENLLVMLAFSPLDPVYPGIEQVKQACDPVSLVEFSWSLFSSWLGADGTSAGDWAMLALAHLAGDEGARRLTPLIRKWPGEGGHARAVKGLDVLATIGTDVALMHLHGISQKLKFKGLQAKAQEKITAVAEARELTTEELADRLVPDLDLDENGTMVLDFGPRRFTVGFDEHLAPFVLEGTTRKKDLPKPGKSDDAAKAKEAVDAYKALKKDVRAIASHQLTRLEMLMCSERRVSLDVFHKFFVGHPLVIHMVRRLVWGAYEGGTLARVFRVDDERRFTSADDEPIELAGESEIGLLHPLAISAQEAARFGELFADYEILQPFEQLGRATYEATPEELAAKKLTRFQGAVAPLGGVRGLENRGWTRGAPQDAGIIWDVTKTIPGSPDLEIVVTLDPGYSAAGYDDFADTSKQKLGAPILRRKGQRGSGEDLAVLGAIQMSELIRDLALITS